MPQVLPFAGVRYAARSDELERLVSPPYDVIGPAELAELRALSAANVIHVELPEDEPGRPGSRYQQARERLERWRRTGVLRPDPRPGYYLSETRYTFGEQPRVRRDLLAAVGLEPWSSGAVLPHEHTMAAPKADRLELLRATHLNSSPIWLTHRQPLAALVDAWQAAERRPPTVDFTWRGEQHRLWLVDDAASLAAIASELDRAGPLYIADGHHRYETALAFRAEAGGGVSGASATLAAITWAADPGLLVLPTHRLLSHLDVSFTLEQAAADWSNLFQTTYLPLASVAVDQFVRHLADRGRQAPSFGVYGLGDLERFAILQLRDRQAADAGLPADHSAAWKALDVSVLHALLVDPLVARTGRPRESVLSYTRDPHEAVAAVRHGRASAALFLNATPVEGVLGVADAHDRMPEKSTYFYPKPPAGLVMRTLDQ